MIYILHGDDIVSSKNEQSKIVTGIFSLTRFDAEKTSLDEIVKWFFSQDLFAEKKALVIENCSKFSVSDIKTLLPNLNKFKDLEETVILWNGERLTSGYLQKLNVFSIREFSLPKFFFQFLDTLQPQRGKELHSIFSSLSQTVMAEQIFYAMVKRIRLLLQLKATDFVSKDAGALSSWQLSKLRNQSARWTEEKLKKFYGKLFEIEESMKTSNLPVSLEKSIDLLLLTELRF